MWGELEGCCHPHPSDHLVRPPTILLVTAKTYTAATAAAAATAIAPVAITASVIATPAAAAATATTVVVVAAATGLALSSFASLQLSLIHAVHKGCHPYLPVGVTGVPVAVHDPVGLGVGSTGAVRALSGTKGWGGVALTTGFALLALPALSALTPLFTVPAATTTVAVA